MLAQKIAQKTKIKDFLIKHKQINSWQAFTRFGITRLGAHIYSLRKDGMPIAGERKRNEKTKTWYKEYYLA